MSLLDVLRSGVKVANTVTKPLQPQVTLAHLKTTDGFGAKTFNSPVTLRAIVDWKQQQVRTPQGELSVSRASILFLDVVALVTATKGEGINDADIITLPDGTTGPILDMSGFIDAGTGQPVATEVFLG